MIVSYNIFHTVTIFVKVLSQQSVHSILDELHAGEKVFWQLVFRRSIVSLNAVFEKRTHLTRDYVMKKRRMKITTRLCKKKKKKTGVL